MQSSGRKSVRQAKAWAEKIWSISGWRLVLVARVAGLSLLALDAGAYLRLFNVGPDAITAICVLLALIAGLLLPANMLDKVLACRDRAVDAARGNDARRAARNKLLTTAIALRSGELSAFANAAASLPQPRPQAVGGGHSIAHLELTPRILVQRPINGPHARAM